MGHFDKHQYPSVHRGIVRAAVNALCLDGHPAQHLFSVSDTELMVEEADACDKMGDRHQGRGLHYYCTVTPEGNPLDLHPLFHSYCNGKGLPAPTPLTVLESEYHSALMLKLAGKTIPAMQSLSRAVHMLADICCPPHTCGLTYFSRYAMMHKRYEARAAEVFWDMPAKQLHETLAAEKWAKAASGGIPYQDFQNLLSSTIPTQNGWRMGNLTKICNQLAESGADELPAVLGEDEIARDASIRRRLLLSVKCAAALLAAFHGDYTAAHPQIPREQTPYWVKGVGSAFVLTEDALYLECNEDGTVCLRTQEGEYLAVGRLGNVYLAPDKRDAKVDFRFGREPLMTLYPEGEQDHLLALIRGRLQCVRRVGHLQNNRFFASCSFALLKQKPEQARSLL